jgi:hypothetical protein
MLNGLTEYLGLEFIRQEGGELIHKCPWCGAEKLYINAQTGAWQCFHGCGQGHPYQLIAKMKPGTEPKDIYAALERFGLKDGAGMQAEPPKVKKDINWFRKKLRLPTAEEIERLCMAKGLDKTALAAFEPMVLGQIAAIPVWNPAVMDKPCGYLRCHLDGLKIKLKSGKEEKYPVIGTKGLYGLPQLAKQQYDAIIYAEGWRDALAAIAAGMAATANNCGAGKKSVNGVMCETQVKAGTAEEKIEIPDSIRIKTPIWFETEAVEFDMDLTVIAAYRGEEVKVFVDAPELELRKAQVFKNVLDPIKKMDGVLVTMGQAHHTEWRYV